MEESKNSGSDTENLNKKIAELEGQTREKE